MYKFIILIVLIINYNSFVIAMENKPYHHLPNGSFRNPEGSPERSENIKWSYRVFNNENSRKGTTHQS